MPFDFNSYSSLLLPAFIQGILFAALLFYRSYTNGRLSDRLLGLLLLFSAIKIAYWMLGYAGWYDTHDNWTSFMFYFPFDNVIWMGPLFYFYFCSLTNSGFRITRKEWKHFILPLAWYLLIAGKAVIDFGWNRPFPPSEEFQYGTKGPWADLDKNAWSGIISYASFFYYLVITFRAFRRYQDYVKSNFSAPEEIRFSWLRNLIFLFSASVVIYFIFMLIDVLGNNNTYAFDWYSYLFSGLILYYLSIAGYFSQPRLQQKLHFEHAPSVLPAATEEKTPQPELDSWTNRLLQHMQSSRPYLEPELSLGDLATQLNTNASVLSKVINDGTGRNFNDFINQYRVQELIRKLEAGEQKTQTLLGLAFDCGFNSKATFNRAFKKHTGLSPRDWLQQKTGE